MRTNPQATFANRVAQFQKEQQQLLTKKVSETTDAVQTEGQTPRQLQAGIYFQARLAVLQAYSPEQLEVIRNCEQNHNLDCKAYNRFIYDLLIAAGDVPTHELRKSTEECGCFSCRGKKTKK
jgi:hypothetical protein